MKTRPRRLPYTSFPLSRPQTPLNPKREPCSGRAFGKKHCSEAGLFQSGLLQNGVAPKGIVPKWVVLEGLKELFNQKACRN